MKNINIIRVILALIIILVSSIYLPEFYWKVTKAESRRSYAFYSPVLNDLLFLSSNVKGVKHYDKDGSEYTRDEFEENLPLFYYRQLIVSGKMPDSLNGRAVDPQEVQVNSLYFRLAPSDINENTIQLFPLFESKSGRVRLELPPDYFRITDRMEFITSSTNTINEEKSELFTNALREAGFTFPAKKIYGNPTTRKQFDEGYFVIDAANKVFHLKMEKGQPFCVETGIPGDISIVYMRIEETELREFYGVIITGDSDVYLISYDNYKLIKLPLDGYDFRKSYLVFRGDLLYRTLSTYDEDGKLSAVVTDRNYSVIDQYKEPPEELSLAENIAEYIFPFEISLEDNSTPMIGLYLSTTGFHFLYLSIVLVILTFFYFKRRNVGAGTSAVYYLLVLFGGVYGVIAVISIRDFDSGANI